MIVRIKHIWYKDFRYDLDSLEGREEFLHDLRNVINFAGGAVVDCMSGDAGDKL